MKRTTPLDKKGLIGEAYRIDGITAGECRSIFLDWALSLPDGMAYNTAINDMLGRYGGDDPTHPMTKVLEQGLQQSAAKPKRRGGRRARTDT